MKMLQFSEREIEKAKQNIAGGGKALDLWNGLVERSNRYVSCASLVGPDDTLKLL
jgi:hypothetical protein